MPNEPKSRGLLPAPAERTQSPCSWLLYEGSERWQRAAQYHLGEPQYRGLFTIRLATIAEIRSLAISSWPLIILWELPVKESQEIVSVIQALSRLANRPLQIVTYASNIQMPGGGRDALGLLVRQAGADLTLDHPEHFALAVRMAVQYQHCAMKELGDLENRPR